MITEKLDFDDSVGEKYSSGKRAGKKAINWGPTQKNWSGDRSENSKNKLSKLLIARMQQCRNPIDLLLL